MEEPKAKAWFGKKTISMFASIALLVNNITGPGVPSIANMYAESGWLLPCLIFLAVFVLTNLSCGMFTEAMRKIPGNEHFRSRQEYTSIVQYFFGYKAYVAAQIGLNGALQALNIVSVIQSAQVMDNAISAIFKRTCGINLSPFRLEGVNNTALPESVKVLSCINTNALVDGNSWGCHLILSGGLGLAAAITIPMGIFDLESNMPLQVIFFILTLACWLMWLIVSFFSDNFTDGDWHLPAIAEGNPWNSHSAVLGTILFNFGFLTTIPSWVNEKKPSVSINKAVWSSTFICVLIFFLLGIPPAMGFHKYLAGPATNTCEDRSLGGCAQSLLELFTNGAMVPKMFKKGPANWFLQASVYLFPPCAIMSSIPVFSIVIKYNCLENGFSKTFSFLWGVLFPWLIALPLVYQPGVINQFITYSSLVFVSFCDFIVPWALYIVLQRRERDLEARGIDPETLYALPSGIVQTEETPLLYDEGTIEFDIKHLSGAAQPAVLEHYAIPPSWGLSAQLKSIIAGILVIVMTAAAVAGIVLQIMTSANTEWDCALL